MVELVVSITVLGLITAVLSSAIAVTLRQQDNSFGRLNVAREEQQIGLWVPADLASASTVDTSPWLTPCGETICDGIDLTGGSNVMLLEWSIENGDGTTTRHQSLVSLRAGSRACQWVRLESGGVLVDR